MGKFNFIHVSSFPNKDKFIDSHKIVTIMLDWINQNYFFLNFLYESQILRPFLCLSYIPFTP